jgi:hypothetical protein
MTIQAIETSYRGMLLRSRTEARWAVFFDELRIQYQYEPEGFDLDGVRYLPDFRLTGIPLWFEVKGEYPDQRDWLKILSFSHHYPILVAMCDVWFEHTMYAYCADGETYRNYDLWLCPRCQKLALRTNYTIACLYCQHKREFDPNNPPVDIITSGKRLMEAYIKARRARFENF